MGPPAFPRAALSFYDGRMTPRLFLAILLLCAACSDRRPPAPTAADNARLDEAEAMLDEASNEGVPAQGNRSADQ